LALEPEELAALVLEEIGFPSKAAEALDRRTGETSIFLFKRWNSPGRKAIMEAVALARAAVG